MTSPLHRLSIQNGRPDRSLPSRPYRRNDIRTENHKNVRLFTIFLNELTIAREYQIKFAKIFVKSVGVRKHQVQRWFCEFVNRVGPGQPTWISEFSLKNLMKKRI
jgi:hypothetical protein